MYLQPSAFGRLYLEHEPSAVGVLRLMHPAAQCRWCGRHLHTHPRGVVVCSFCDFPAVP